MARLRNYLLASCSIGALVAGMGFHTERFLKMEVPRL
jgi:hypothetical protein